MKKLGIISGGLFLGCLLAFLVGFLNYDSGKPMYEPRKKKKKRPAPLWNAAAQYYWMIRRNVITGNIEVEDLKNTWEKIKNINASAKSGFLQCPSFEWEFACCDNIGGRTRAIWINPSNSSIMLAGSVSGGIYRSTDGGSTWNRIEFNPPNAIVSCITHGPDGTVYVGTGSSFDNYANVASILFPGFGIYKSKDGLNATVFEHLSSTTPQGGWPPNTESDTWSAVNAIAVHPQNPAVLFAGTHRGIRYSTDGGQSWSNPIAPNQAICHQLKITPDGGVLYWFQGNKFYVWKNPPNDPANNIKSYTTGSATGRVNFDYAPGAPYKIWLIAVASGTACLDGVYVSNDTGKTWQKVLSNQAPFTPCESGGQCQGIYDLTIAVDPDNPERVFLGCVTLWAYDGNLTMIALPGGTDPWGFNPKSVHVDNHFILPKRFDQSKVIFIGNDGGIYMGFEQSPNDFLFTPLNRNYISLQCYSIGYTPHGWSVCGTQDNGTNLQFRVNTPYNGLHLLGGDGFDCEASFIARNPSYLFGTIYSGAVYRLSFDGYFDINVNSNPGVALLTCSTGGTQSFCQNAPFYTPIRLWETVNDLLSKDTLEFKNTTDTVAVAGGDGITKKFEGYVIPLQPSAKFYQGSIKFITGTQVLEDPDGDGILTGSGSGQFSYSTGYYKIQFNTAPGLNSPIYAVYDLYYNANDTLYLISSNGNYPITYVLSSPLMPGDVLRIQDRVQAMLAWGGSNAVYINRLILKSGEKYPNYVIDSLGWVKIPISGIVTCMAWSSDGNYLFVGTQFNGVYRISNLRNVHRKQDASLASVTKIYSTINNVQGIDVHPADPNKVVIALAEYGYNDHVYMATNAATSQGPANFVSIQGNLPPMPCYAVLFVLDSANTILVGTDYGIWGTCAPAGPATQWVPLNNLKFNNSTLKSFAPVYDIKQNRYPPYLTYRRGEIFVGSHGLGMWRWSPPGTSPVGTPMPELKTPEISVGKITIAPNPASSYIKISLPRFYTVSSIKVTSISGRIVYEEFPNEPIASKNISISDYASGIYLVVIKTAEGKTFYGKFVKK